MIVRLPLRAAASRAERRVQVFLRSKNLAAGAIHSPRGSKRRGTPRTGRSVGRKRNKNAELSKRALEALEGVGEI